MTWNAQSFIDRVLTPKRIGAPWWSYSQSEAAVEKALAEELKEDIPGYLRDDRRLFFFSSHPLTRIDGRVGSVGVEEKCAHLHFGGLVDGAIHRGVAWVIGNPYKLDAPEAVSLYVVKPGTVPISDPSLSHALSRVLSWLAAVRIHVMFINAETGESWGAEGSTTQGPIPRWLATDPRAEFQPLMPPTAQLVEQLKSLESGNGVHRYALGANVACYEYAQSDGAKLAYADWSSNHWQIIEIGLLLRGAGYDAVKVNYAGTTPLQEAGLGVERRIQAELSRRFGVVLDWGVSV
jgi:hypothetical protein